MQGHEVRQEQCKPIASADFLPRALTTSATAVSDDTRRLWILGAMLTV